jgi:hypothetical protein
MIEHRIAGFERFREGAVGERVWNHGIGGREFISCWCERDFGVVRMAGKLLI